MKIYKTEGHHAHFGHSGYHFAGSQREAASERKRLRSEAHTDVQTQVIEVTPTKAGIVAALNAHAGHRDNG